MIAQLALAFVAGSVATANPCGFALLPAYLARQLGTEAHRASRPQAVGHALAVGGLTSVGFLLVFVTIGSAISLGARWLAGAIPWVALAIGILLAASGVVLLTGRRFAFRLPLQAGYRPDGGSWSALLFGIGYGTTSLSCTLPIFLVVVGTTITTGALWGSLMFAAYAAGMGTVLTALAVAAALSREGLAAALRRLLPHTGRLSGALLLAAGAYVVYYWAYFLLPGSSTRTGVPTLISAASRLSTALQTWLSGGIGGIVSALLFAFLAVLTAWLVLRRYAKPSVAGTTGDRGGRAPIGSAAGRSPITETSHVSEGSDRD